MAFVTSSFAGAALRTAVRPALSARRAPAAAVAPRRAVIASLTAPSAAVSELSHAMVTLAAKESDFGGYVLPVAGLLVIGIIIALLTPPVKD
jgi:hypothetical protein